MSVPDSLRHPPAAGQIRLHCGFHSVGLIRVLGEAPARRGKGYRVLYKGNEHVWYGESVERFSWLIGFQTDDPAAAPLARPLYRVVRNAVEAGTVMSAPFVGTAWELRSAAEAAKVRVEFLRQSMASGSFVEAVHADPAAVVPAEPAGAPVPIPPRAIDLDAEPAALVGDPLADPVARAVYYGSAEPEAVAAGPSLFMCRPCGGSGGDGAACETCGGSGTTATGPITAAVMKMIRERDRDKAIQQRDYLWKPAQDTAEDRVRLESGRTYRRRRVFLDGTSVE